MRVCCECGGKKLYSFEFRTDYACPRFYVRINESSEEKSSEDSPYRMSGTYCEDCDEAVSTVDEALYLCR